MKTSYPILLSLCMVKLISAVVKEEDGVLVDYRDDCNTTGLQSCGHMKCCVKESMVYIPEFTGPKPKYRIACLPLRKENEFCMTQPQTEMCPCEPELRCVVGIKGTIVGHCRKR